jgi:hypothetical protein
MFCLLAATAIAWGVVYVNQKIFTTEVTEIIEIMKTKNHSIVKVIPSVHCVVKNHFATWLQQTPQTTSFLFDLGQVNISCIMFN